MNEEKTFDFTMVPGQKLNDNLSINDGKPLISIITAYYNCGEFIEQTANSILNQTFPYWEWIIVNDGSTEIGAKELLESLAKKDRRIHVYHKKNEGLPKTRDYAIERASCELIYILDSDDAVDPTCLECSYWALKTNPEASWVYCNTAGFGNLQYLWDEKFNVKRELKENVLCVNSLIYKSKVLEVGGFSKADKGVYEDWHLWLRLLAKGYRPLQMNYYGFWYRRRDGVLKSINNDKKKRKNAMRVIKTLTKQVDKSVKSIILPQTDDYNYNSYPKEFDWNRKPILDKKRKNILFIFPWLIFGGADKFDLDLISNLDPKKYHITIVTTERAPYVWRQEAEKYAEYFDLNTFLKKEDWAGFIDYLMKSRNIDLVFQSNSLYGYYVIPWLKYKFPSIPFVDYIHNEDFSWRDGGFPRDSIAIEQYLDMTYTCNSHLADLMYEKMDKVKHNTKTVYIGVDTENFDPNVKYETNFDFSLYKNKKIVLYICRICEFKRPIMMLSVMKKLKEIRDDIVCFVVGDGDGMKELRDLTKKWDMEDNIIFFGAQKEVRPFYQVADVTLICSLIEGLTLTAYESLAMGLPVVTSDVGGQKELVHDDLCGAVIECPYTLNEGLYVRDYTQKEINDYADAIIRVLNNDNDSLRSKRRELILKKFSIKEMVKTFDEEFTTLISNGSKVSLDVCNNKSLAINYLILFNQLNKRYIDYGIEIDTPKKWIKYKLGRFRDILWRTKIYRGFVMFCKKIGLVSLKRKIFKK